MRTSPPLAPRIELMGLAFDAVSESRTATTAVDAAARGEGGWICPVNLDVLRQWTESAEVQALVEPADLVVADGMPLIWAARLAGEHLPERVAGSSLIRTLPRQAAGRGLSIYLLGGNEGAADAAADVLRSEIPGLRIAGTRCPPFGFERDPNELAALEADLVAAAPEIVFVGLGFPKQERLIARLRPVLPGAWFVSCGISFSFVSGEVQRAPEWIQRLGLEWLHRMTQEPKRLVRRYLMQGLPFLARLAAAALRHRAGAGRLGTLRRS